MLVGGGRVGWAERAAGLFEVGGGGGGWGWERAG